MKKLLLLLVLTLALLSCDNKTKKSQEKNESENITQKTDKAEDWLKNIFKCENRNGYCFYLDREKQICTKRFYEFMLDSEELFGASNLTETEYPNALSKYQKKWSKIYPLRNKKSGSAWLFGRGQDDKENIQDVKISKISNLKYSVFVDYGEGLKTQNEVILIIENNEYKIDFCNTEFIEDGNSNESEIEYPKTGKKPIDFLPKLNIYEIQYETEGDLNNDALGDIAIVLKNKESKIADRPMLILLQNKDKTYRLDKVSNLVMPIEYNEADYKIYDTEDISIDKGILNIQLYGIGPSGNLFSNFKYLGNDLILTYIETYNIGAGSWQQLYYDLEKGELIQEITNTMEENMPSNKKKVKLEKEKHLFENTSPENIIQNAYKKLDNE